MPSDEAFSLETLEADQFQRYSLLSRIMDTARGPGSLLAGCESIAVLDVGSGPSRLCQQVLGDGYRVTRCDIDTFGQPDILPTVPGQPLGLADGSFDVVTAIETLEHVLRPDRSLFLSELVRVARHLAVISCPHDHPQVVAAEQRISDAFAAWNGTPHPFLSEHSQYGLPSVAEVVAILEQSGRPFLIIDNSRLDRWEANLMLDQLLRTKQDGTRAAQELFELMNQREQPNVPGSVFYRKFYLVAKDPGLIGALESLREDLRRPPSDRDLPCSLYQIADIAAYYICHKSIIHEATVDYYISERRQMQAAAEAHHKEMQAIAEAQHKANLALYYQFESQVVANNELRAANQALDYRFESQVVANNELRAANQALDDANQALSSKVEAMSRRGEALQAESHARSRMLSAICGASAESPRLVWRERMSLVRFGPAGGPSRTRLRSLLLRGGDGPLSFVAALPPGCYRLKGWVMVSTPTEIHLQVAGASSRLAVSGTEPQPFHINSHLAAPAQSFSLATASGDVTLLVLMGDLRIERLPTRPSARRAARRMLSGASRLPVVRDLVRTPLVQEIKARLLPRAEPLRSGSCSEPIDWGRWRIHHTQGRQGRYPVRPRPGMFSIITPVWNTPVPYLKALAQSILAQSYDSGFEWVVLDNGSDNPQTLEYLQTLTSWDPVRLFRSEEGLGIIGGTRFCLERATGRYLVPVDHDDYIFPDALQVMAWHIERHDYPPLLYSDEDRIFDDEVFEPYLKPDWDPVLFHVSCYTSHLGALDRELALRLGAYTDRGTEGSPDWDAFTRFVVAGHRPVHVPEVLYSWRLHEMSCSLNIHSKPYVYESQRNVIQRFLNSVPNPERYRIELSPLFPDTPDWWIHRSRTDSRPLLSVVLSSDPDRCDTRPLLAETNYPDHAARAISRQDGLAELLRLACEQAARCGLIHLVAEGIRMEGEEWPWEVLTLTEIFPDIAMVGGRVLDVARRIVAAGEYFGFGGDCRSPDLGRSADDPGYYVQMKKQRSVSAASSMLAVADAAFLADALSHGGHRTMSLPFLGAWAGAFAWRTSRRVVYSPHVTGSCSGDLDWGSLVTPRERATFRRAHRDLLPDTRFLSRFFSRDPARPYCPDPSRPDAEAILQPRRPSYPAPHVNHRIALKAAR